MSNPKYLPIPKKIPYNIRMPQHLLDKLNSYAELTGNTTTDVVIGALNDFMKGKIVYNDYLPNLNGLSLRLPVISSEKTEFYNTNLIGENSANDLFNEVSGYEATTEDFEILKIPNNLDVFNETFGYHSFNNNIGTFGNHKGIEFFIIPEVYTDYSIDNDVFDTLYCLYFIVDNHKLKSIELIDYLDAINIANDNGKVTFKNNLILCINELKELENKVKDGGFDGAEYSGTGEITNRILDAITIIADKYNSGNIIPLGANIGDAVVTAKINTHPELYDEFMDDIKDNTEKYVDEIIAERVHNILDYRLSNMEKNVKNDKDDGENTDGNIRVTLK